MSAVSYRYFTVAEADAVLHAWDGAADRSGVLFLLRIFADRVAEDHGEAAGEFLRLCADVDTLPGRADGLPHETIWWCPVVVNGLESVDEYLTKVWTPGAEWHCQWKNYLPEEFWTVEDSYGWSARLVALEDAVRVWVGLADDRRETLWRLARQATPTEATA